MKRVKHASLVLVLFYDFCHKYLMTRRLPVNYRLFKKWHAMNFCKWKYAVYYLNNLLMRKHHYL